MVLIYRMFENLVEFIQYYYYNLKNFIYLPQVDEKKLIKYEDL